MEKNNSGQLDFEDSPGRAKVKICHSSKAGRDKNNKVQFSKAKRGNKTVGGRIAKEASHRKGAPFPMGKRILQQFLRSEQEGRRFSSNIKLEETETYF